MGRYLYELISRLREEEDMRIFIFNPINDDPDSVVFFPACRHLGKNLSYSMFNLRLKRWIRDYELDLIHLQGGPGGSFLFLKQEIPVIYTVYHTYYQQGRQVPSQHWKKALALLERASYERADHLASISKDSATVLLEHYGIPLEKISLIPCGVNIDLFRPRSVEERQANLVLFVGRFDRRKGLDFLLRAFSVLLEKDPTVELLLVGGDANDRRLKRWVNGEVRESVRVAGRVTDEELVQLYNSASVVVVPSIFEGFGLTVLEAMACGAPVIGTDVEGIRELIEPEKDGLLVEHGDIEALAAAMLRLLNDEDEASSLAEAGLAKVRAQYNWADQAEKMKGLYERMLCL
ncbi:MAG: glycosyltransferase family 4 protein [Candidatus Geothermincolia bacterium]